MKKTKELENALAALTVPVTNLYNKAEAGLIKDKANENEIRASYFCAAQAIKILSQFKLED